MLYEKRNTKFGRIFKPKTKTVNICVIRVICVPLNNSLSINYKSYIFDHNQKLCGGYKITQIVSLFLTTGYTVVTVYKLRRVCG